MLTRFGDQWLEQFMYIVVHASSHFYGTEGTFILSNVNVLHLYRTVTHT